jgi:hypothetical protein
MAGYPRRYKNEPCKVVLLGVCLGFIFSHNGETFIRS